MRSIVIALTFILLRGVNLESDLKFVKAMCRDKQFTHCKAQKMIQLLFCSKSVINMPMKYIPILVPGGSVKT